MENISVIRTFMIIAGTKNEGIIMKGFIKI